MPAKTVSINLLHKSTLDATPTGRIITWAITYGRYIMVGTEIVVLLAFISRFSLDRNLTDLKEEITQKQAILEANAPLEQDIRDLQQKLGKGKQVLKDQPKLVHLLTYLQTILPSDVLFTSIEINQNKITLSASAGTNESFASFLSRLSANKEIKKIDLSQIQKHPLRGIEFQLNAQLIESGKKEEKK